jgi:serine/threonine kinase PknH
MFLEMRLIEGTDLDSVLKRFGPLTPPRAVAIITQIASALDAAHAAGVMHRDVKPPNVLVTRDDFAYLVDFGIASAATDEKLTQLGTAVGTWKYMAPERFSNDEVTYRADIYALACVLYECLTGSPPYRADSAGTLISAHMLDPIPQPSTVRSGIPKPLDAVIARGMAKKPEDRYASASDLATAAREALSDPDQDHAADILRRSQESALPAPSEIPMEATQMAATDMEATQMAPPQPHVSTPPPYAAQTGQPWAPGSGPMPAPSQQSQPNPTPQYYQGSSGNWGGPPPGGPQQFSGPAPWNQAPPAKPKRNPWPIVAGVAALVVILVAAAIGIWMVMGNSDDKSQRASTAATTTTTTRATTTTTTPTSSANLQSKLMNMLPAGYASGTCTAATPKPDSVWATAVAMVNCGQNTEDGGPSHAVYGLFANLDALKQAFDADIGAEGVQLMNCPGGGPSPDGWHRSSTPNVTAGQIACSTFKNQPNVTWSNESKLMLSDVFGNPPAIDDLHTWWTTYA